MTKQGRKQQIEDEMEAISVLIERAAGSGFDTITVSSFEREYKLAGKYKTELANLGYILAFFADGVKIKW